MKSTVAAAVEEVQPQDTVALPFREEQSRCGFGMGEGEIRVHACVEKARNSVLIVRMALWCTCWGRAINTLSGTPVGVGMASLAFSVQSLALESEPEKEQEWDEGGSSLVQNDLGATALVEYGQSSSSKSKGKEKEVDVCADVRDPAEITPETVCKALWFQHYRDAAMVIGKRAVGVVQTAEEDEEEEQVLDNSVPHEKDEAESKENEEWTCAICLDSISMEELSLIKGCGHAYCTHCILKWAAFKAEKTQQSRASCESTVGNSDPVCPTCKHPFNTLVTARALDGTVKPHLEEESLSLLLRALWFAVRKRAPSPTRSA